MLGILALAQGGTRLCVKNHDFHKLNSFCCLFVNKKIIASEKTLQSPVDGLGSLFLWINGLEKLLESVKAFDLFQAPKILWWACKEPLHRF